MYLYFEAEHPQLYGWTSFHANWAFQGLKYEKHFQKMYRDVGMAVPKTTETRCRDGSVQGRHVIQRLHN